MKNKEIPSAADMTKLALLNLENSEEWHKIGGRIITVVHDEVIAEVPIEHYEEAGNILSSCMSEAGNFLPFSINCDVTTTLRWYGLEYPCPYDEPTSLDDLTESNIKWIQYMLIESEYLLPVFKDADGNKPLGDAAEGVSGIWSDQMSDCIEDYMKKYGISRDRFIPHIKNNVIYGIIKGE